MPKKSANFKGRKRGGRERSSRPARVGASRLIDPGLTYALRAVVRVVLALVEKPHTLTSVQMVQTLAKLQRWLDEADAWHRQIPVRERTDDGEDSPVAPREGNGGSRGQAVRRSVVIRKKGSPPSWPTAVEALPSVEELKDDGEA